METQIELITKNNLVYCDKTILIYLLHDLKKSLKEQDNPPESSKLAFAEGNLRLLEYRLNKLKLHIDYCLNDKIFECVNKLTNYSKKIIAFTESIGYNNLSFKKQKKLMTNTIILYFQVYNSIKLNELDPENILLKIKIFESIFEIILAHKSIVIAYPHLINTFKNKIKSFNNSENENEREIGKRFTSLAAAAF